MDITIFGLRIIDIKALASIERRNFREGLRVMAEEFGNRSGEGKIEVYEKPVSISGNARFTNDVIFLDMVNVKGRITIVGDYIVRK